MNKHFESTSKGTKIKKVNSDSNIILRQRGTQLSKLKMLNKAATITDITVTILNTVELLGKDISANVLPTIAEMICEKYYYLKIEEFDYIMKSGVMGDFGDIPYNTVLPANLIFEWIDKYNASDEFIEATEKRADEFKKNESKGRNTSILESKQFIEKLKQSDLIMIEVFMSHQQKKKKLIEK